MSCSTLGTFPSVATFLQTVQSHLYIYDCSFNSVQFTSQEILLNQTFQQLAAVFFSGWEPLNPSSQPLNPSSQPLNPCSQPPYPSSQPLNPSSQPLNPSSKPPKKIAADCRNVWFNNISWLVNCTELKPDDT